MLDVEKYVGQYGKSNVGRFVDFMTRVAFEQVLPHKSVAEASDSRKTPRMSIVKTRLFRTIARNCREGELCRRALGYNKLLKFRTQEAYLVGDFSAAIVHPRANARTILRAS